MIALPATVRVYAAVEPVDLRAGFDPLAHHVRELIALDPLSGALFLFFNRRANRAKVLCFTSTGYYLVYKRLEHGRLRLPRAVTAGAHRLEMSAAELALVLEGVDLRGAPRARGWAPVEKSPPSR